jgi:segregation and condensation protein B
MNTEYTRKVMEAAMLAAGRTLSLAELAQLFDPIDRPDNDQLRGALTELGESYSDRAVELLETAQGFRVQVRREFSEQVSRLWPERPPRYSRALLETLSIIAYRQPLTRGEIENVRGVAVNPNIIKTLFERNWIRVVGHREVPGRPELLGTTRDFLDYFGLRTLDQLPPLSELKSLEELDPQLALPVPGEDVNVATADADAAVNEESPADDAPQTESAAQAGNDEPGDEQPAVVEEPGAQEPGVEEPGPAAEEGDEPDGERSASEQDEALPVEEPGSAAEAVAEQPEEHPGSGEHERS